jgi:alpha-L-rhamnosidase
LKRLAALVEAGATVVGPRPTAVPGLKNWEQEYEALDKLASELWGAADGREVVENAYGKGRVISGLTADEVLKRSSLEPDFSYSAPSEIDFIHRSADFGEIYFLRNYQDEPVSAECKFRVTGMYPEFWDASTGAIHRVETYEQEGGVTTLPIELPARGSVFVVFNKGRCGSGD